MMVSAERTARNELLIQCSDFAFYVNKSGWRAKKNFMVLMMTQSIALDDVPPSASCVEQGTDEKLVQTSKQTREEANEEEVDVRHCSRTQDSRR